MLARLPLLALLAALALCGASEEAAACSPDPCGYDRWFTLEAGNGAAVPTDGVFVVHGERPSFEPLSLDQITIAVTLGGAPVDGAAELVDLKDTFIWRPAAPLVAGATYSMAIEVVDGSGCAPVNLPSSLDFVVTDGPAPALTLPELAPSEEILIDETIDVDHLVCCDGAYPEESFGSCDGSAAYWSAGACASTQRRGRLKGAWTVGAGLPPELAGMVAYRDRGEGVIVSTAYRGPPARVAEAAYCGTIQVVNLADINDTVSTDLHCFGGEPASPLGVYEVVGVCGEDPYTCVIVDDGVRRSWDPEQCSPYDPPPDALPADTETSSGGSETATAGADTDGDEASCACRSAGAGEDGPLAPALVLVGVGLVRRRRPGGGGRG